MGKKMCKLVCISIFLLNGILGYSDSLHKHIKHAIDRGLRFLRYKQLKNGSWENHPGITALVLLAFTTSPRKYNEKDGPFIRKPVKYLLSLQKENGAIYDKDVPNYCTSIAILALASLNNPKYDPVIKKASNYLLKIQCDEGEGYNKTTDYFYGGIGYGGDERPDLSNTQFALAALKAAGISKDNPVWKKALVFISRCQNRSESNDLEWAGDDGGFVYAPNFESVKAGTYIKKDGKKGIKSYGSMSYAGLASLIFCNVSRDDPRVKSVVEWIKHNYTVDYHPGMGTTSLFYYYYTFAKAFHVYGKDVITISDNTKHKWAEDLAKKLLSIQQADGSWKNSNPRYWEANRVLTTAYAINALNYCYKH